MGVFPENEREIEITEKRVIKRVTFRNFISNVFDAFNITRGGFYTFKMILKNPGQLARDYLGTSRYHITAPFKILILTTAIALIIMNSMGFFDAMLEGMLDVNIESQQGVKRRTIELVVSYFNLILWTYIPVSALISFLFNRKAGINYAENLVFQTFILSITNIAVIISYPIFFISEEIAFLIMQLLMYFYIIYAYKVFFQKKWLRSFSETSVVFLVGSFIWSILLIAFIVMIAVMVSQ